jgi:hypothetical protein
LATGVVAEDGVVWTAVAVAPAPGVVLGDEMDGAPASRARVSAAVAGDSWVVAAPLIAMVREPLVAGAGLVGGAGVIGGAVTVCVPARLTSAASVFVVEAIVAAAPWAAFASSPRLLADPLPLGVMGAGMVRPARADGSTAAAALDVVWAAPTWVAGMWDAKMVEATVTGAPFAAGVAVVSLAEAPPDGLEARP